MQYQKIKQEVNRSRRLVRHFHSFHTEPHTNQQGSESSISQEARKELSRRLVMEQVWKGKKEVGSPLF